MNKKAAYAFRIVLGGYLAYLGVQILIQMVKEEPTNMIFMCVTGIAFVIIGVGYAAYSLKKVFDIIKEENHPGEPSEADEPDEPDGSAEPGATVEPGGPAEPGDSSETDTSGAGMSSVGTDRDPEESCGKEKVEEEIENDYEEK